LAKTGLIWDIQENTRRDDAIRFVAKKSKEKVKSSSSSEGEKEEPDYDEDQLEQEEGTRETTINQVFW
jgi:hypothetical protein